MHLREGKKTNLYGFVNALRLFGWVFVHCPCVPLRFLLCSGRTGQAGRALAEPRRLFLFLQKWVYSGCCSCCSRFEGFSVLGTSFVLRWPRLLISCSSQGCAAAGGMASELASPRFGHPARSERGISVRRSGDL